MPAPTLFLLDVTPEEDGLSATLRLTDGSGVHLGAQRVRLAEHPDSDRDGIFRTRAHVDRVARDRNGQEAALERVARFLGERVLGPTIARCLAKGIGPRTLLVRVPRAAHTDDPKAQAREKLAADFARVPWELAKAPGDRQSLAQKHVALRIALTGETPGASHRIEPEAGEPLRVLLVFAHGPAAKNLLAVRHERERLLEMFFRDVFPRRNVEVDVLAHGLSRDTLVEQIRRGRGYHVIHWSGHGKPEGLVLESDYDVLSGEELVDLFQAAGVFLPSLFFLGACWSGAEELETGHVGTARALLGAGIPQVVAMRDAVRDTYAGELARLFHARLLAEGFSVEQALAQARSDLLRDARAGQYHPADHADPVLFGADPVVLVPASGRSAQMDRQRPRPQPLLSETNRDLDPPRGFVGRYAELSRLRREWLSAEDRPAALITGIAGMGKTTIAAEAIHLWHGRFDYVLAVQTRGEEGISFDNFCREIHRGLLKENPEYEVLCRGNPRRAVFFEADAMLTGEAWLARLRQNLLDALLSYRILLVLDNFETNLWGTPEAQGRGHGSKDPAWDALFAILPERLAGSNSRLLVTSRHLPRALHQPERVVWVQLGALSLAETKLFVHGRRHLESLKEAGGEDTERLERLLERSGGHPFVLARLDYLVARVTRKGITAAARAEIDKAIEEIEVKGFAASRESWGEVERSPEYLEEVAFRFADQVIGQFSPAARLCLWVLTRAEESAPEEMLRAVWEAEEGAPALEELVEELLTSGLVQRETEGGALGFHALVAERAGVWMATHLDERGARDEAAVLAAMGGWYQAQFVALLRAGRKAEALQAGRRGIRALVRALAFERLAVFAGFVVTSTQDPVLLESMRADLKRLFAAVPAGRARWGLRLALADALKGAGRPDEALPLFEEAAAEAEVAEAWPDLGVICQNWANAARDAGHFDEARALCRRSAEADTRAGRPRASVLGSELEALRIDVMQGRAEQALPDIAAKLGEARSLWAQRQRGEAEAPDDEMLVRVFIGALDVAREAHFRLAHWPASLDLLAEIEAVGQARGEPEHARAATRFNRYGPLLMLAKEAAGQWRGDEARVLRERAKEVLAQCLDVFRGAKDITNEALARSALADVWDELGDLAQALGQERLALALRNDLPSPNDRAVSNHNLSNYLHKNSQAREAAAHWLAGLAYDLVTGIDPRLSLEGLSWHRALAASRGETFTPPALADLLQNPEFTALRRFLQQRSISVADLQTRIDEALASVPA